MSYFIYIISPDEFKRVLYSQEMAEISDCHKYKDEVNEIINNYYEPLGIEPRLIELGNYIYIVPYLGEIDPGIDPDFRDNLKKILSGNIYKFDKKFGMEKVNKFVDDIWRWMLSCKNLLPYPDIQEHLDKIKDMIGHFKPTLKYLDTIRQGKFVPIPQGSIDDIKDSKRLNPRLQAYSKINKLAGEACSLIEKILTILQKAEKELESEKPSNRPEEVITGLIVDVARTYYRIFNVMPSYRNDCPFTKIVDMIYEAFGLGYDKDRTSTIRKAIKALKKQIQEGSI